MQIVQKSRRVSFTEYDRYFEFIDTPGAGYAFKCDEAGTVVDDELTAVTRATLEQCLAGAVDGRPVRDMGARAYHRAWMEPAVGRCDCGTDIELGGFTNTCDGCGADYNWNGTRLAPREQWGEETGEHWTDIINIP